MAAYINNPSVQKVIKILSENKHSEQVIELESSAGSAHEAASSLNVEVGAIVKTLIFRVAQEGVQLPIAALISGDRKCDTGKVNNLIGGVGDCEIANPNEVKRMTGYSIGGVSPIGLPVGSLIFMDDYLRRFETIWSSAGHPFCVFPSKFMQLKVLINATVSDQISI